MSIVKLKLKHDEFVMLAIVYLYSVLCPYNKVNIVPNAAPLLPPLLSPLLSPIVIKLLSILINKCVVEMNCVPMLN